MNALPVRLTLHILLALAGCTTGPAITPMATAPDVFVIARESPGGFPAMDRLKANTLDEARRHCEARQAALEGIDSQVSSGWNLVGNTPRFQARFRCVARPAGASPG